MGVKTFWATLTVLSLPLPKHYSADVEVALKTKLFNSVAQKQFVGSTAAAMLCYKCYPTSADYQNMGRTVIAEYSFLKSTSLKSAFKEFRREKTKKHNSNHITEPHPEKP